MRSAAHRPATYVHGPLRVTADHGRRGIAGACFRAERVLMGFAEVIAVIREDNHASRRAQARLAMDAHRLRGREPNLYLVIEGAAEYVR